MKISTRGRYALRLMLELALAPEGELVTIKSIAARQGISEKYLEQIIIVLSRAGYVKSTRGSQGGYRLAKAPADYTVGMILRTIEGSLVPVACMEDEQNQCSRADICVTLEIYKQLYDVMSDLLDNITLTDLVIRQLKKTKA